METQVNNNVEGRLFRGGFFNFSRRQTCIISTPFLLVSLACRKESKDQIKVSNPLHQFPIPQKGYSYFLFVFTAVTQLPENRTLRLIIYLD